jgi:outer membrane protein assembly factor BamA
MHFQSKLILAATLLLLICSTLFAQQTFKIAKVEFEGLNKLSPDEMIATTQLKVGETFELPALDAAAQRLMDSGLFKNVAYRTKSNHDQITITFVVEEAKVATSRVIFDNFIWFSDSDLIAAVRKDVPSFSGTAPDNGDMVERITRSLQTFLHENKIEATVSYMASQDDPGSSSQEHVFSVTGIPMPICTIHFPGAKNISEAKLIESSKSLLGNDYSHKFVSLFSTNTLFPLYRERGQLKAAFAPPSAKPEETANCKSGVELTIPVDEGLIYKWEKAEWTGNNSLKADELNSLLGMQPGETANGVKLDKAEKEIHKAYGRKGFMLASIRSAAEFNDANQTVIYKMDVQEGPQFRMGKFSTKGFTETMDKALRDRWPLKPGDVFDQGAMLEFSQKQMSEITRSLFLERRAQNKPAPNLKFNPQLNRENQTVDVTLELAN